MVVASNGGSAYWFLEGSTGDDAGSRRILIDRSPFQVGRHSSVPLNLKTLNISRLHAELVLQDDALYVRDLGSRNGTYVNHQRIEELTPLSHGDKLHFGTAEFHIWRADGGNYGDSFNTMSMEVLVPDETIEGGRQLLQMVDERAVTAHFQPIVLFQTGENIGYEVLGRGTVDGLSSQPMDLFKIASSHGIEAHLSRLFRIKGVEIASQLPGSPTMFFNIHPVEMSDPLSLLSSIEELRELAPDLQIIMEIHETAVTDLNSMRSLKAALRDWEIGLAYDDFGAGQARLLELVEVPPDFLKFDRMLLEDVANAPKNRRSMLHMLATFASEVGVHTVAEGIETREDADACAELGFTCGQGYFFGRPGELAVTEKAIIPPG